MTKNDVYQSVTDRILASLERGTVPWKQPWTSTQGVLPYSLSTGKPYRGINVFLLLLQSLASGYSDPRWGTFRAIKNAGGHVRKGEKGTRVILWKPVPAKRNDNGETERDQYLLLREYVVFNAEQADGLPTLATDKPEREHAPSEITDAMVDGYLDREHVALVYGGERAFYRPSDDIVRMPHAETFHSPEAFYGTLFHELVHSTGHESRLDRIEPALFGTDPYAREELVAELGAAMLRALTGVATDDGDEQSAAYIHSWAQRFKDDPKLIVQAAAQAQRAADLIGGTTFDTVEAEEAEAVAA
jgi:antirestriction protein ArdC